MKFFGWMQNKLHGKQEITHRPSMSSVSSYKPREEFSDWPHGLLAIGTFGSVNNKEVIQEETNLANVDEQDHAQDRHQDLSSNQDFTPEEVGKLQKELTKLLTRKAKKRKSDVNKELTNLPLDRFLNCPSSLEVDRRDASDDKEEEEIERTISVILSRCKSISKDTDKKRTKRDLISKNSVSYLLKKMFVCTEGFSLVPRPSLKDTFQESRMEKLLRMMLQKKINAQASSKTSTKRYLQEKKQLLLKNEEEEEEVGRSSSDGGKWVKTDSDFIVLEI